MGHHYVPQEYLRGFASDAALRFVWMFDKAREQWTRPAIKTAAQEREFYSPEIEERLAREIEGPGHIALNRLRSGAALAVGERDAFALYVAVLIMRVPRNRERTGLMAQTLVVDEKEESPDDLMDLRTTANASRIDAAFRAIERAKRTYREELPATVQELVESPWPSLPVIASVQSMHWRLIAAPADHFFITSDTPAHHFSSLGLGTDDAELTVPLASDLVLHGTHQGSPGGVTRFVGKRAFVKEINRRIAFAAHRFVFSSHREEWIPAIALRARPGLKRIVWDPPV